MAAIAPRSPPPSPLPLAPMVQLFADTGHKLIEADDDDQETLEAAGFKHQRVLVKLGADSEEVRGRTPASLQHHTDLLNRLLT